MKWMAALAVTVCIAPALAQTPHSDLPAVEREVIRLVNQERAKHGVPALEPNEQLTEAARKQAALIAERRQLSHRFSGQPILGERLAETGLHFDHSGENASETGDTGDVRRDAADVHGTLMLSPPHRENLLSADYNSIGVGAASAGGHIWLVQDFAHIYAPASVADVESRAAQALNRARRQQAEAPLEIVSEAGLRQFSCRANVTPALLLATFPNSRFALVYTVFNVDQFPADLVSVAAEHGLRSLAVAACPESQKERHGSFRVVMLLFTEHEKNSSPQKSK